MCMILHNLFCLFLEYVDQLSSNFHDLRGNSRNFGYLLLKNINILIIKLKVRLGLSLYNHMSSLELLNHVQWHFNDWSHLFDLLISEEISHLVVWSMKSFKVLCEVLEKNLQSWCIFLHDCLFEFSEEHWDTFLEKDSILRVSDCD